MIKAAAIGIALGLSAFGISQVSLPSFPHAPATTPAEAAPKRSQFDYDARSRLQRERFALQAERDARRNTVRVWRPIFGADKSSAQAERDALRHARLLERETLRAINRQTLAREKAEAAERVARIKAEAQVSASRHSSGGKRK